MDAYEVGAPVFVSEFGGCGRDDGMLGVEFVADQMAAAPGSCCVRASVIVCEAPHGELEFACVPCQAGVLAAVEAVPAVAAAGS